MVEREKDRMEKRDVLYVHECMSLCVCMCVFIERKGKVIMVVGDEKPFFYIRTARTRMIIEKKAWEMRNLFDGMQPKMTCVFCVVYQCGMCSSLPNPNTRQVKDNKSETKGR